MRTHRDGLKVRDAEKSVVDQAAAGIPRYPPDYFIRATEVCAMKDGRHADEGEAPIIAHAGETIDNHFGVRLRGLRRSWQSEGDRRNCDDPVNGFHDSLPMQGQMPRSGGSIVQTCLFDYDHQ